jgi:hypothetical protein
MTAVKRAAADGGDHDDSQADSKVLKAAEGASVRQGCSGKDAAEQPTSTPQQLAAVDVLRVRHAVSGDKGTRPTMEDVHVVVEADASSDDNSQR